MGDYYSDIVIRLYIVAVILKELCTVNWSYYRKLGVAAIFGLGQVLNVVVPLTSDADFGSVNGIISFALAVAGAYGVYQVKNETPTTVVASGSARALADDVVREANARLRGLRDYVSARLADSPALVEAAQTVVGGARQVASSSTPDAALQEWIQAEAARAVAAAMTQQTPPRIYTGSTSIPAQADDEVTT